MSHRAAVVYARNDEQYSQALEAIRNSDTKSIDVKLEEELRFWPADKDHQKRLQNLGQSAEKGTKNTIFCHSEQDDLVRLASFLPFRDIDQLKRPTPPSTAVTNSSRLQVLSRPRTNTVSSSSDATTSKIGAFSTRFNLEEYNSKLREIDRNLLLRKQMPRPPKASKRSNISRNHMNRPIADGSTSSVGSRSSIGRSSNDVIKDIIPISPRSIKRPASNGRTKVKKSPVVLKSSSPPKVYKKTDDEMLSVDVLLSEPLRWSRMFGDQGRRIKQMKDKICEIQGAPGHAETLIEIHNSILTAALNSLLNNLIKVLKIYCRI
jgi:hypothetical protein